MAGHGPRRAAPRRGCRPSHRCPGPLPPPQWSPAPWSRALRTGGTPPVDSQKKWRGTGPEPTTSDDDTLEQPEKRASIRRHPRVDLAKLDVSKLRKYRRFYGVCSVTANSKDELMPHISKHFETYGVNEDQALAKFLEVLRSRHASAKAEAGGPVKKKRGGKPVKK